MRARKLGRSVGRLVAVAALAAGASLAASAVVGADELDPHQPVVVDEIGSAPGKSQPQVSTDDYQWN